MARTKITPAEGMRRCIGSAKFAIEGHDAPVADFPSQPSQRDGLGRMCRVHWTEYTRALRKAATDGKAKPTPARARPTVTVRKPVVTRSRTAKTAKNAEPEPVRVNAPRKPKVAVPAEA